MDWITKKLMQYQLKKAKKIVKEYEKQSSITENFVCDHDWRHLDSSSNDIICIKCNKSDWF